MKKIITVYCASSSDVDKIYLDKAFELGMKISESNCEIVYGGGNVGLMGSLANGALSKSGYVTGIIPDFLMDLELGHKGIQKLISVKVVHQRQRKMMDSADIIMVLPGGCGTFLELFEAITWKKLNRISCPIIIINIENYFDNLLNMLKKAIDDGFMREDTISLWTVVDDVSDAVRFLHNNYEFVQFDVT
jgi:uncharacterized protein (TIGR00730 family)